VAGDLFETTTPAPQAQALVMNTLLKLRGTGREVVVLAGNHDNLKLVDEVYRPVLGELGVHVLGQPKRPDRGGTLTLPMRTGETAKVAALPFLSYRFAVRAAEVVLHESAEHSMDYARRVGAIVAALCQGFADDTVNIITTHCTVLGGRRGGGEREVQTLLGYELPAQVFPSTAHYAALGHLHRYQEIDGPCPIAYSGSPLSLDFGEESNESMALIVTATPGARAHVRPVPVTGGRTLRTLRGTLDHVIDQGQDAGDAFLRVVLEEKARAGLADQVRDRLPNVLEVQIDEKFRSRPDGTASSGGTRLDRPPTELFADFLAEQSIEDARVGAMFAELLEDAAGNVSGGGA
jgi:exonuclease SbcD